MHSPPKLKRTSTTRPSLMKHLPSTRTPSSSKAASAVSRSKPSTIPSCKTSAASISLLTNSPKARQWKKFCAKRHRRTSYEAVHHFNAKDYTTALAKSHDLTRAVCFYSTISAETVLRVPCTSQLGRMEPSAFFSLRMDINTAGIIG